MDNDIAYKDVVARITDLIKATYLGKVNAVYEGDPIVIPDVALPAVIVEKLEGSSTLDATGTDIISEHISVRLVMNKRDDLGASDEVNLTERKLRLWIEGRDPATGYYLPDTLMYLLRTNITLGNEVLDSDIDVRYDVNPRPEDMFTSEGQITLITRTRVIVPNRI